MVWLDYIAWQEDIGHLTMMLSTLRGLFYVIAWGNLLQEVSANGVILFLCVAIYIYTCFSLASIFVCLFFFQKKHTFIITEFELPPCLSGNIFIYYL